MFVIEAAINKAAEELGIAASEIQQKNLLNTGDEFPYGQKVESEAHECWHRANEKYNLEAIQDKIKETQAKLSGGGGRGRHHPRVHARHQPRHRRSGDRRLRAPARA